MPGAKSEFPWSPCSSDMSDGTFDQWLDGVDAKSFFSSCVGADSVRDFLLSPDAAPEGCALGDQRCWSSGTFNNTQDTAAVAGSNVSLPGLRRPAATGQSHQSQHDTPALLAAIVDGALQAASAPGVLSVSAAGPLQQLAARPSRPSRPASAAASTMLNGLSLLDQQQASAWQGGSQEPVRLGWPETP